MVLFTSYYLTGPHSENNSWDFLRVGEQNFIYRTPNYWDYHPLMTCQETDSGGKTDAVGPATMQSR